MSFLPITRKDMDDRGWEQLDFLFISGDAYVDHPSFGHAIITRLLESEGYRVGIIPQPDWHSIEDFKSIGCPKLAVLIASGVIDSMVNHYTAGKKVRSNDQYSPGGKAGLRPDRAVMVYANKVREAFKDVPVIIGGIEASLRRFAHYDYWDDKVRRSILLDSKADMLVYGMGERPILELASLLKQGMRINEIKDLRGTVYVSNLEGLPQEVKEAIEGGNKESNTAASKYSVLPSYEEVSGDKKEYAKGFKIQYDEQDAVSGKTLIQKHGGRYLVQNPPALPLEIKELDRIYSLPYERTYHPVYEKYGGIPAIEEVQFSITSHRGCYGGCAFCALNFHQGRAIQSRSQASIINEAKKLTWLPNFKGYIHDVGGPTANFRKRACVKQVKSGVCKGRQCLHPEPCKNLVIDHSEYLSLLRKVRELPGIKKVFIRSGIRYDYLILDKNDEFFNELCEHHVSGQLKVAPEHVVDRVLEKMGKPGRKVYERFVKKFYDINKRIGKEQYLVPYFISSHPGSDLKAAVELAEYLRDLGYNPEQVQDFYPTPGTLSTCMYYTGLDPRSLKPVYVPRSPREKAMQRALLQFRKRENYKLVYEALVEVGREDLIGFGRNCLIRPERAFRGYEAGGRTSKPGREVRGRTAKPDREVKDKNARPNQGVWDKNTKPNKEVRDKNIRPNQEVKGKNAKPNKEIKGKNARPNKEIKDKNTKPNKEIRNKNTKPNKEVKDKNIRPNQEVRNKNAKPNKEVRGKNIKPNQEVSGKSTGQGQRTVGNKRVESRKG